MGLTVQEIAQIVVDAEPPVCPYCSAKESFKTAMAQVLNPPDYLPDAGEAVIVTYLCDNCKNSVHTFA